MKCNNIDSSKNTLIGVIPLCFRELVFVGTTNFDITLSEVLDNRKKPSFPKEQKWITMSVYFCSSCKSYQFYEE